MKKSIGIKLAVVVLVSLLLTGCGSKKTSVVGEYSITMSPAELAGNTGLNGFVTAMMGSQINTLELKEDGSYVYSKLVVTLTEDGKKAVDHERYIEVLHTFYGQYENDGTVVTLKYPKDSTFDENWGGLISVGVALHTKGRASDGDLVEATEGQGHNPLDAFHSKYYNFLDLGAQDVVITLALKTVLLHIMNLRIQMTNKQ